MDEMENRINSILSDPGMMQQIMQMASSLGAGQPRSQQPPPCPSPQPAIDPAVLQRIMQFAGQTNIDQRESSLLRALGGYLSRERIGKLEKAMRAAKIAKLAGAALNQSGAGG